MPLSSQHLPSHNSRPGHYITFALETEALHNQRNRLQLQTTCTFACAQNLRRFGWWGLFCGDGQSMRVKRRPVFDALFPGSVPSLTATLFQTPYILPAVLLNNADITLSRETITCSSHFVKYIRSIAKYFNETSGRSS
jgi:hypothetical protein